MNFRSTEWQIVTLEDIARKDGHGFVDGPFGSNLPASEYVPFGIPVIRGTNLSLGIARFKDDEFVFISEKTAKRLERSLCSASDIIFTKKGTLGQTGIIPFNHKYEKFLLSSNQMKLSVDIQKADPLFVYYYVSSSKSQNKIIQDSEVTGVPKTNLTYLRKFPILLPPLPEQKAIAHILGTLDDKIELNQQMNQTLEAIAKTIFKSWFVDFDPVKAKIEGRQPVGMDAATAELFPDSFEKSALGLIPKGWRVGNLSDIANFKNGKSLSSSLYTATGINPVFGSNGQIARTNEILNINSVLVIGRVGAYCGSLHRIDTPSWVTDNAIVAQPKPCINFEFLHSLFKTIDFNQTAIGSAQPLVTQAGLKILPVIIPSLPLITRFGEIITHFSQLVFINNEQSHTLSTIRDNLLPKLMSGKIRVEEAESIIEQSV